MTDAPTYADLERRYDAGYVKGNETMPVFAITLAPYTVSPVIRRVHTTTKQFEARNLHVAKRLAKKAFENNINWYVVRIARTAKPKGEAA